MKRSIGRKLFFSYTAIALVTLLVTGVLFYTLVRQFLVQEALSSLHQEAQILVRSYQDQRANERYPGRQNRFLIRLTSQLLDSQYAIVTLPNQEVVETSMPYMDVGAWFPINISSVFQGKEEQLQVRIKGNEVVMVAIPVPNPIGQVNHAAVLMTSVQGIQDVTKQLLIVLAEGFVVALFVTITIAWFVGRSLSRPVRALAKEVGRIARRDFTPSPIIQTGDELEILSRSINEMASSLGQYDEAQRRFLQHASHELKSPLMAIQGYAEGIRDGVFVGEEAERGLDTIGRESGRLKQLVDDLIYLSKLETLDDLYQVESVRVDSLIIESIEILGSVAARKHVRVEKWGSLATPVRVDPNKMLQALINLISNAIRHASQSVIVDVRGNDKGVSIHVRDDGTGIQEADMNVVFQRFYRGDTGETGLGLAITKAIIDKSGGQIEVSNQEAGGAEFVIHLPYAES